MNRIDELIAESCADGVEFRQIGEIADVGTGSSDRKDATKDGAYPFYVRSKEVMRIGSYGLFIPAVGPG